jgi:hypothetical protein
MKKKSGKRTSKHANAAKKPDRSGGPPSSEDTPSVELTGTVQEFRTNHHDDLDGLKLVDGTVIRFPPHVGHEIEGKIELGDEVHVIGANHETPHGDIHVRASFIECQKSGFEIDIDRPEKKKQKGNHSRHDEHGEPSLPYQEILTEIAAIRTLMQDQIVPSRKERHSQHDCVLKELKELRSLLQPD